ncbi:MAG TPA: polysaccharide deacetylase family protein [Blastocatellia bacterium]|nr:polysaccharide deacetylase family protein [Blastocatellia bacterium]
MNGVRTSLPVLTFHSVDDQSSVISFSPRLFRDGLAKLRDHGYHTIDLMEAVGMVKRGETFPDRSFVITFDDGYRNAYSEAFPVLQQSGMSATVFVTVGEAWTSGSTRLPSQSGRDMLSWDEIREMHASGSIRFGAHTLTHPDLTTLPADRVEAEVRDSKSIIEDALSAPVASFAYPFGRYDERSREIASRHFECACSDRLGLITAKSDAFALERVDAYYLRTDRLFDILFTNSFSRYIWARSVPRRIKRALTG